MHRVEASPTAAHLMANIPGLRHRVEEALQAVIEAAIEIARLQTHPTLHLEWAPLKLHVGNWAVTYYLDLPRKCAKVVFVEKISVDDTSSNGESEAS